MCPPVTIHTSGSVNTVFQDSSEHRNLEDDNLQTTRIRGAHSGIKMKIRLIISSSLQNTGDQSSGGAGERGESGVRAWPAAGGDRGEGQHQHGDPRQHADRQGDGVHHHRVQVRHQCPVEINTIHLTQRSFETGLRGATIYPSVSRYLRILSKY